ncbi:hypothetical protein SISNIDRAFT_481877 [Sistotremastrum niveocremeum HHB9708]|uniref:Uncharacterized protein n=1 Tax=Sistotremastrum niveocremeum HHB9708 TaxID=1314777 RepID=A0A164ZSC0_9AGAM|nr:hypothetical protein SISNIDRAFT_481877 [Sistotremastrum niveocremeum HHB9708]
MKRPGWSPSLTDTPETPYYTSSISSIVRTSGGDASLSEITEDEGAFGRPITVDMREHVHDATSNMSISPTNRDVVLAARNGLFIIDLESPNAVPRHLPQGGTWNVADVQWNPHISHWEYVVSTSNEKLLIWNLSLGGNTAIQTVLHKHYRAITDVNWHTHEPNVIASTGLDSWVWLWDIRVNAKPTMGLCAFNPGATQVKWNRHDPNVLASSHLNTVVLWDRRKGTVPLKTFRAHSAKIYGIDWGTMQNPSSLVTCSLDNSIKLWDTQSVIRSDTEDPTPINVINTSYPVWRARNTPFGKGVLALPQRSETTLEMWSWDLINQSPDAPPVAQFAGHKDIVKEYVWRVIGFDNGDPQEYQLITWTKDRMLRLWPIQRETIKGVSSESQRNSSPVRSKRKPTSAIYRPASFRDIPIFPEVGHTVGDMSVLLPSAEHRSASGDIRVKENEKVIRNTDPEKQSTSDVPSGDPLVIRASTMTRGGKTSSKVDLKPFTWLTSVRIGEAQADSGSGHGSVVQSRQTSRSRPGSVNVASRSAETSAQRDDSLRTEPADTQELLKEEIVNAINALSMYKLELENVDVDVSRTCTIGFQGDWSETSVYMRVTFQFPPAYPLSRNPSDSPDISLERNPLIPRDTRLFLLRTLRSIRDRRPCLEDCLRFLVGDQKYGRQQDSSDDESQERQGTKKAQLSVVRGQKNIPEFRNLQGYFGPNGEIICFFGAPKRFMRGRPMDASPPPMSAKSSNIDPTMFQTGHLSVAVRKLSEFANLHDPTFSLSSNIEADNVVRVMDQLLIGNRRRRATTGSRGREQEVSAQKGQSVLSIRDVAHLVAAEKRVAQVYIISTRNPSALCEENAAIARKHGRYDHERMFRVLQPLVANVAPQQDRYAAVRWGQFPMARQLIVKLYEELCGKKDLQLLAMMAVVLFQAEMLTPNLQAAHLSQPDPHQNPFLTAGRPVQSNPDYFGIRKLSESRQAGTEASWGSRTSDSPTSPVAPRSFTSSISSKSSWSSIINSSGVRLLMGGNQDRSKIDPASPTEQMPPERGALPSKQNTLEFRRSRNSISETSVSFLQPPVKSAAVPQVISRPRVTIPPSQPRRLTFSQAVTSKSSAVPTKRLVVDLDYDWDADTQPLPQSLMDEQMHKQCEAHIRAYAEMLPHWGLMHKRAELMKCIPKRARDDPWRFTRVIQILAFANATMYHMSPPLQM